MPARPLLDQQLAPAGGSRAVIEEGVVVEILGRRGEAGSELRQVRQVLREQLEVDEQVAALVARAADEVRRLGDRHGRPVGQAPELAVALQHVLARDPVRELKVAAGRRLQLERIRQEQGSRESRLGVALARPIETGQADAGDQEQPRAKQPAVLEKSGRPPGPPPPGSTPPPPGRPMVGLLSYRLRILS